MTDRDRARDTGECPLPLRSSVVSRTPVVLCSRETPLFTTRRENTLDYRSLGTPLCKSNTPVPPVEECMNPDSHSVPPPVRPFLRCASPPTHPPLQHAHPSDTPTPPTRPPLRYSHASGEPTPPTRPPLWCTPLPTRSPLRGVHLSGTPTPPGHRLLRDVHSSGTPTPPEVH